MLDCWWRCLHVLHPSGQFARFEIDATSVFEVSYAWYRTEDGQISPETDIFMGDAPVLEIPDVQETDEAYYYC